MSSSRPYQPYAVLDSDPNSNSLWSDGGVSPQPSSDYDSLTLPPINPDHEFQPLDLPHFDQQYYDPLPLLPSPSVFADSSEQQSSRPPPSNEHVGRREAQRSQYRVAGSESPDPFDEFTDFTPPSRSPPNMSRASSVVDLTESSSPTSRKRKAEVLGEGRVNKAARVDSPASKVQNLGDIQVVDLVDVEDEAAYEVLRKREKEQAVKAQNEAEAKKERKLAEFECIICMGEPIDLTVTHCGHLFCSECLHQALHAGDRKCCPVCRTAIILPKPGHRPSKNGVFPLEIKLMTARKREKQPDRAAV